MRLAAGRPRLDELCLGRGHRPLKTEKEEEHPASDKRLTSLTGKQAAHSVLSLSVDYFQTKYNASAIHYSAAALGPVCNNQGLAV